MTAYTEREETCLRICSPPSILPIPKPVTKTTTSSSPLHARQAAGAAAGYSVLGARGGRFAGSETGHEDQERIHKRRRSQWSDRRYDDAAQKRFRYKIYQRRHRAKQHDKARLLEEQVVQLTEEIARLTQIHETAGSQLVTRSTPPSTRHTLAGPPAQLVREYFRLFEHGYSFVESHTQAAFVRTVMAMDIQGPYFSGPDQLLDQWHRYSQVFASVHVSVGELSVARLDEQQTLVVVSTTWRLRVQRVGVLAVFPSINGHDDHLEDLVGNPLVVEGSLRVVIDSDDQVTWLGAEMAFAKALTRSVGSFANASLCLQAALLDASSGHIATSGHEVNGTPPVSASHRDVSFRLPGPPP